MFVVGDNLKSLMLQHGIVDHAAAFDEASLTLRLSRSYKEVAAGGNRIIVYGEDVPDACFKDKELTDQGVVLEPHECILACSVEQVKMPLGYLGFIQTKGSLARLFVTVHCCDAQIDPGFEGHVTFEIVNLGPLRVKLKANQDVAQLFVAKTSTKEVSPYNGRYQKATGPTVHRQKM